MNLEDLPSTLYDAFSRVGKALSSSHRLRILNILSQSEMAVDELANRIGHSTANTSTHLKVLRQARLVKRRKEGKRVYYQIANENALRLWLALRDTGLSELPEVRELMDQYADEPDSLSVLDGDELIEQARRGEIILLDLRKPREYESGHLPHARSIPASELEDRIDELPRGQRIVAYCRGPYCVAEIKSAARLRERGFEVRRLHDSVLEWRAAGRSLATTNVKSR